MKRLRIPGLCQSRPNGRRYRAEIEIVYAGGSLPSHLHESLVRALDANIHNDISDLSLAVSSHLHNHVTIAAIVDARKPLAAISQLDAAVDDALLATGLFEEFDVTGKMLSAAPLEDLWP